MGVIYIGPSIIAAYIYLSKPSRSVSRTDLENIGEEELIFEERRFEDIDMVKGIEQAENFEQIEKFENVERFENYEESNDFDNDGKTTKGNRPKEKTYTLVPIRAKDDEWEIV